MASAPALSPNSYGSVSANNGRLQRPRPISKSGQGATVPLPLPVFSEQPPPTVLGRRAHQIILFPCFLKNKEIAFIFILKQLPSKSQLKMQDYVIYYYEKKPFNLAIIEFQIKHYITT